MKRMGVVAGLLAALLCGALGGSAAAQCMGCAQGCVPSCPGNQNCASGGTPFAPFCATWGSCWCLPGTDGDGGDPLEARLPRPRTVATAERGVTLYQMTWEIRGPGRAPLDGGVVMGGLAPVPTPDEVRAAAALALHAAPARLRPADGGVFVGAASFQGAFATRGGDGYALEARRAGAALEVAACRVSDRALAGPIARETLQRGEALLVPLVLDGRAYVMALVPSGAVAASRFGTHDPRSEHARFTLGARARLGAEGAPGLGLEVVETIAAPCR